VAAAAAARLAAAAAARRLGGFHSAAREEQERVGRDGRHVADEDPGGLHALQVHQVLRAELGQGHLCGKR